MKQHSWYLELAGVSDVGLIRERNEDVLLALELDSGEPCEADEVQRVELDRRGALLAVFDGMGGANAGDRAAGMAASVLTRVVHGGTFQTTGELGDVLHDALMQANDAIRVAGSEDPECHGMGTTATVSGMVGTTLVLAQVGDSRAYLLRGDRLLQLTEDQSLFNELVNTGRMPPEEVESFQYSNVILQALGISKKLEPTFSTVSFQRGDLLLLCSDGLTAATPEPEILAMLTEDDDLQGRCAALTELARKHGGHDNATVLLARFERDAGEPEPDTQDDGPADPDRPPVQVKTFTPPAVAARVLRRRRLRAAGLAALVLVLLLGLAAVAVLASACGASHEHWAGPRAGVRWAP